MKIKKHQKNFIISKSSGFTLVEALVVLFIFSLITITFYSVMTLGGRYIIESKNHLGAVALANEKMEIIRNLKYDDIGIVAGIPSGNIVAEEDVTESQHKYHVKTFIKYVDDPFDGTSPTDLDYKAVKVTISWQGAQNATSSVSLISRFVPAGIEQSTSGGTLSINIIGSNGIGVPQASVHIVNNNVSPAVNLTAMTDNTGNLMLPGAKQSVQKYNITVTKDDYETVNTIDPASVTYSVTDTPASVVQGVLNTKSIVEDKMADLKINSVDYLGVAVPSVSFHLEGGRILGSDMSQSPAAPKYNFISDDITDATGEKKHDNISPGQFFVSNIGAVSGHTFAGLDSCTSFDSVKNMYTLLLAPNDSKEIKIKFANDNDNSVLLSILNPAGTALIANAQVQLTNALGYSENITTLADGIAFFPVVANPLIIGTYDINIIASGYKDYVGTIDVDKLTTQQIKLEVN
jgi:competence protein ComGC